MDFYIWDKWDNSIVQSMCISWKLIILLVSFHLIIWNLKDKPVDITRDLLSLLCQAETPPPDPTIPAGMSDHLLRETSSGLAPPLFMRWALQNLNRRSNLLLKPWLMLLRKTLMVRKLPDLVDHPIKKTRNIRDHPLPHHKVTSRQLGTSVLDLP